MWINPCLIFFKFNKDQSVSFTSNTEVEDDLGAENSHKLWRGFMMVTILDLFCLLILTIFNTRSCYDVSLTFITYLINHNFKPVPGSPRLLFSSVSLL